MYTVNRELSEVAYLEDQIRSLGNPKFFGSFSEDHGCLVGIPVSYSFSPHLGHQLRHLLSGVGSEVEPNFSIVVLH